ncbi:hypothetical protein ACFORG_11470 [Lutimaribacter marinistellae]|uniref:Uncharacterized protein n=1 Tax=Lutimaribacter marinistellae TaxID=1820329 RepID=A0ABV7TIX7_9RHOB
MTEFLVLEDARQAKPRSILGGHAKRHLLAIIIVADDLAICLQIQRAEDLAIHAPLS